MVAQSQMTNTNSMASINSKRLAILQCEPGRTSADAAAGAAAGGAASAEVVVGDGSVRSWPAASDSGSSDRNSSWSWPCGTVSQL